jgi:hypothetical protein
LAAREPAAIIAKNNNPFFIYYLALIFDYEKFKFTNSSF